MPISSGSKNRAFLFWVLKLLVAIVLLFLVLNMVKIDDVLMSLKSAKVSLVLVAFLLLIANLAARILKWKMMLKAAHNNITTWEAVASILLGISLGSFTPAQIGELSGRFMRVSNGKSAHVVGLAVLDRAQVFLVLAITGLASYFIMTFRSTSFALISSLLCTTACLMLYFHLEIIKKLNSKLPTILTGKTWFVDFLESFGFLSTRQVYQSLLYTILFNAILYIQMYFLLNAFGSVDFWATFLGFSAMMFFKALLPISLADLGVREVSTVYFFSLLAVPSVVALNAALMMFAINMIVPSILGLFFLPSAKLSAQSVTFHSQG